jgi:hypothetical protein
MKVLMRWWVLVLVLLAGVARFVLVDGIPRQSGAPLVVAVLVCLVLLACAGSVLAIDRLLEVWIGKATQLEVPNARVVGDRRTARRS